MVEYVLAKDETGVRFSLPAPELSEAEVSKLTKCKKNESYSFFLHFVSMQRFPFPRLAVQGKLCLPAIYYTMLKRKGNRSASLNSDIKIGEAEKYLPK